MERFISSNGAHLFYRKNDPSLEYLVACFRGNFPQELRNRSDRLIAHFRDTGAAKREIKPKKKVRGKWIWRKKKDK